MNTRYKQDMDLRVHKNSNDKHRDVFHTTTSLRWQMHEANMLL